MQDFFGVDYRPFFAEASIPTVRQGRNVSKKPTFSLKKTGRVTIVTEPLETTQASDQRLVIVNILVYKSPLLKNRGRNQSYRVFQEQA